MSIDKEFLAVECGVEEHLVQNSLYETETKFHNNIDKIYSEILDNMRLRIVSDFGSVARFSREKGFCKYTLSRVFQRSQNLSLSHYIKILVSLGVLPSDSNTNFDANLTVLDYLKIDHNAVSQSFLTMVIG